MSGTFLKPIFIVNSKSNMYYWEFERYIYIKIIANVSPINVVENLILCPTAKSKSKN